MRRSSTRTSSPTYSTTPNRKNRRQPETQAELVDHVEPHERPPESDAERLRDEQSERALVVSTQVLQELYASLTAQLTKGAQPIATPEIAENAVRQAAALTVVHIDVPLVLEAIVRCREHSLSFWDSLIIGAAMAADCRILLSEDMNDGQMFGALRVVNPFA